MKTPVKLLVVGALAVALAGAIALKRERTESGAAAATNAAPVVSAKLPKLLDLGADKCVPCKMMAPILEELKTEYAGRMSVEFIDVWKNKEAGKEYGVEMIPTQIFYDAESKELFRHTGFFGKDDILAKWKELGVDLAKRE